MYIIYVNGCQKIHQITIENKFHFNMDWLLSRVLFFCIERYIIKKEINTVGLKEAFLVSYKWYRLNKHNRSNPSLTKVKRRLSSVGSKVCSKKNFAAFKKVKTSWVGLATFSTGTVEKRTVDRRIKIRNFWISSTHLCKKKHLWKDGSSVCEQWYLLSNMNIQSLSKLLGPLKIFF